MRKFLSSAFFLSTFCFVFFVFITTNSFVSAANAPVPTDITPAPGASAGGIIATKASSCQVNLTLSADPNAISYVLQYTTTPTAPNFISVPGYNGQATEFSHFGINPNTKIVYRYKIIFDSSESGWFDSSEIDTGDFSNPGVPTNVSGLGSDGGRQIEIDWSPSTFGVAGPNKGYEIERSLSADGVAWSTWSPVRKNTDSNYPSISGVFFFPDNDNGEDLRNNRAYKHRIRSFQNDLGCIPSKEKQSAWVEIQTPTTPTNFKVDYPFGVGTPPVSVTWSASIGANTYKINGTSTINSTDASLSIADQPSVGYTLNDPTDGATYNFSIRGCTATSCSAPTTERSVIVDNSPNELISRIFYIDEVGKKAKLNLSWLDNLKNGTNEPSYQFERAINDGAFTTSNIGSGARFKSSRPQNEMVETFDEVDLNKTYKYKVQGKLLSATSVFSPESFVDTKVKYILRGAAWSGYKDPNNPSGLEWLVMNSDGIGLTDSSKKWNVNILQDGFMSGVAWSKASSTAGYGWLSFNREDLVGCPDNTVENCAAKLMPSGEIRGWARFISLKDTKYEWVSLSNVKISGEPRVAFVDKGSSLERLWRLVRSPEGNTFLEKISSRIGALFNIAFAASEVNYGLELNPDKEVVGEIWNPELGWIAFTNTACGVDTEKEISRCLVTVDTVNTPPVISDVRIEPATLGELIDSDREGSMWCAEQPTYKITWHYFDADGDHQASSTINLLNPDNGNSKIIPTINRLSPIAKVVSTDPDSNARYKILATEFKPLVDLGFNKNLFAQVQSEDGRGLLSAINSNSNSLGTTTPASDYPLISVNHDPNEMKVNEPVKFSSNITRISPPFSYEWTFASGTPKTSDKSGLTVVFGDVVTDGKAYNLTIRKGDNWCSLWGGNVGGGKEKPPRYFEEN
jgi:hypothetical protein